MTRDELVATLGELFPGRTWPKPFHVLQGVALVEAGKAVPDAARTVGTSARAITAASDATDIIAHLTGLSAHDVDSQHRTRAARIVGQLLVGRCAEAAFEDIYRREMGTEELELRDLREGRTDTDYRLLNGRGRPLFRINIKFHGSLFRGAKDYVGLDPQDCFALATYKIHSALQKQQNDALPYFFAIVGVPGLTGDTVGREVPSSLVETVALVDQAPKTTGKRDFEDAVVESLVAQEHAVYQANLARIEHAEWYVLSARRAEMLLRRLLFERVFALRVRNYSRLFRNAELDMHFSLSTDLTPLKRFLSSLRANGPQQIATLMERGDF